MCNGAKVSDNFALLHLPAPAALRYLHQLEIKTLCVCVCVPIGTIASDCAPSFFSIAESLHLIQSVPGSTLNSHRRHTCRTEQPTTLHTFSWTSYRRADVHVHVVRPKSEPFFLIIFNARAPRDDMYRRATRARTMHSERTRFHCPHTQR